MQNPVVFDAAHLHQLFAALQQRGYRVIAPTMRDGAIVYDEASSVDMLPVGWTDEQEAGTYRLKKRADRSYFGYVVGPHSWKSFLHPPVLRLWRAQRQEDTWQIDPDTEDTPRYAFIGVRACELQAMAVQDRVFMQGSHVDPTYAKRRENVFIVAVNCGQAGGTCFCVSMQTGPKATGGFDLALTEILEADTHHFVVEVGSERGAEIVRDISHRQAAPDEQAAAERVSARAAAQMGRTLDTTGIQALLYRNVEHAHWDEVAARCLSCANCTMVCPTCFCTTVEDVTDLTGQQAERWRKWDSCFTMDFSYIHDSNVRSSTKARYRHWLTHKLATWIDQFDTSGCVGCGRCITWCPVGIDLTEEVRAIQEKETHDANA